MVIKNNLSCEDYIRKIIRDNNRRAIKIIRHSQTTFWAGDRAGFSGPTRRFFGTHAPVFSGPTRRFFRDTHAGFLGHAVLGYETCSVIFLIREKNLNITPCRVGRMKKCCNKYFIFESNLLRII